MNGDGTLIFKELGRNLDQKRRAAVTVKPLEWIDLSAETPFGNYDIGMYGRYWAVYFNDNLVAEPKSEAEGKRAAQADFEERIRSVVTLKRAPRKRTAATARA